MSTAAPGPVTAQELEAFHAYVSAQVEQSNQLTLENCLQRWREIQGLQQAIRELESMHEAAAGCGYSRDEIIAQYQARLQSLR